MKFSLGGGGLPIKAIRATRASVVAVNRRSFAACQRNLETMDSPDGTHRLDRNRPVPSSPKSRLSRRLCLYRRPDAAGFHGSKTSGRTCGGRTQKSRVGEWRVRGGTEIGRASCRERAEILGVAARMTQ